MPFQGKIKRLYIWSVGRFSIFVFTFGEKTKCSAATEADFVDVDQQMDCLLSTIKDQFKLGTLSALANMRKIETTTQTEGYCQFSGGGDICLNAELGTLVFQGLTDENNEDDEGLSPIYSGTSTSTTMLIEGKRSSYPYEKLKYCTSFLLMPQPQSSSINCKSMTK